jgi:hypothetical protein
MLLGFNGFGRFARGAVMLGIGAALVATAPPLASGQTLLQRLFPRITGNGGAADPGTPGSGTLTVDPKVLGAPAYCPELRIPLDGEAFAYYDADRAGEASSVRYLGSIIQTARECLAVSDASITMKVGIAGRIVAGPRGGPGKVTMPVRITAIRQRDNSVLFNKAYNVSVTLGSAALRADFSQVIEPVTFKRTALDEDIIIYIGFDHSQ